MELTQEKLKEIIHYDPHTGVFRWIKSIGGPTAIWKPAGWTKKPRRSNHTSYRSIMIAGKTYRAHRLAWLYVYGELPKQTIDHINKDGLDNRIANLRDVSIKENCRNLTKNRKNRSGIMGVHWHDHSSRWMVRISQELLGYTKDFFEACCLRKSAEIRDGYHPTHGMLANRGRR